MAERGDRSPGMGWLSILIVVAKMGTIKDRNGMHLTEAEDIKRWQEYTEELYKKGLHDSDNHDGAETPVLWPPHAKS